MNHSLISLTILLAVFMSCNNDSKLAHLESAELVMFVDSLKNNSYQYKLCEECTFSGLQGEQIVGFTQRYPPEGNYDKKEIEIGDFDYQAYTILDSNDHKVGTMYVCYFNENQKELFLDFFEYYINRIKHYKQHIQLDFKQNTAVITLLNNM